MSGSNNVFAGSKGGVFQGSVNNVRGFTYPPPTVAEIGIGFAAGNNPNGYAYGLPGPPATPPTDGVFYSDILYNTSIAGYGAGMITPVPSDGPGRGPSTPNLLLLSGSLIEDPGLHYWLYYGQYSPISSSSVAWSKGPTFQIISSTAAYPSKNRYLLKTEIAAGLVWPNAACIQSYISLFGDGSNLFAIGPAYTPPFYNDFLLPTPANLVDEIAFNPQAILNSSSPFYLILQISGGPSSLGGAGSSEVGIALKHN